MAISPDSAAGQIARLLKRRGIKRVFALCGGHIMPIWMRLDAEGIRIIDVRDERAAPLGVAEAAHLGQCLPLGLEQEITREVADQEGREHGRPGQVGPGLSGSRSSPAGL